MNEMQLKLLKAKVVTPEQVRKFNEKEYKKKVKAENVKEENKKPELERLKDAVKLHEFGIVPERENNGKR